jgi:hypothetical protein
VDVELAAATTADAQALLLDRLDEPPPSKTRFAPC